MRMVMMLTMMTNTNKHATCSLRKDDNDKMMRMRMMRMVVTIRNPNLG